MQATVLRGLGTQTQLSTPNPQFLPSQSSWPEKIGVDEKFLGKILVKNNGGDGEIALLVQYKGETYGISLDGAPSRHLPAGAILTLEFEGSFRDMMGGEPVNEEFEKSKDIKLNWQVGYVSGGTLNLTDQWETVTHVTVGLLGIPTWAWIAGGAGLAVVGVIMVTKR